MQPQDCGSLFAACQERFFSSTKVKTSKDLSLFFECYQAWSTVNWWSKYENMVVHAEGMGWDDYRTVSKHELEDRWECLVVMGREDMAVIFEIVSN